MHFMNPVPIMQLVELARGMHTSHQTFEVAKGLAEHLGKQVRPRPAGQQPQLPPPPAAGLLPLRARQPAALLAAVKAPGAQASIRPASALAHGHPHLCLAQVCVSEDRPGFIVNRVLMPMINEGFFCMQEVGLAGSLAGGLRWPAGRARCAGHVARVVACVLAWLGPGLAWLTSTLA
jgi:hypothetical protein